MLRDPFRAGIHHPPHVLYVDYVHVAYQAALQLMQCQQHPTPRDLLGSFRAMETASHKSACRIREPDPETPRSRRASSGAGGGIIVSVLMRVRHLDEGDDEARVSLRHPKTLSRLT